MSEDDEDLPRLLGGRYRLEAVIGHGGMGVVYRGVDRMMKRPIAVKLIRAIDGIELDDEVAGRFLREAKNTARVQHPHIVQVFDLGRTDEGALYLVMELLEGESLSARMRKDTSMDPAAAIHIARQICEALEVAHTAGVIHRDLKPANVQLLRRGGDDSFVKVLDFGVAKSYSPDQQTQLTQLGMLVGTVDYMAPEQIMGKAVDGRADIYSLGIVLYKMLAGRAPFPDNGVPALIHAHLNTLPAPLIEVAPGVPNALDRVILRCLAKDPDHRYESMAELGRALGDAVPDEAELDFSDASTIPKGTKPRFGAPILEEDDNPTLARPSPAAPEEPDEPEDAFVGTFEDATLKMDRSIRLNKPAAPPRSALPMIPRGQAGTAAPRDSRPYFPEEGRGAEARVCVMCQTLNVPHARICSSCGVSLAPEEQAVLQARLRAVPRPAAGAPAMSPNTGPLPPMYDAPITGPLPLVPVPGTDPSRPAFVAAGYGTAGRRPAMTGPQAPPGWLPPGHPPPPPPPRSMWERFLTWTGLRSR
jgi:serine/threonine-protein kinase